MDVQSTDTRYGTVARGLHWISAALVLILVPLGLAMTRIGDGDNTTLYRIHVALGLLVALLTIIRVAWRVIEPSPTPPPMSPWRRALYLANHYALYIGLFALATTGIAVLLSNDLTPFPTEVVAAEVEDVRAGDAHFVLALIYSGLFLMHIAGVLSYQRTKADVLSRMGLNVTTSRDAVA